MLTVEEFLRFFDGNAGESADKKKSAIALRGDKWVSKAQAVASAAAILCVSAATAAALHDFYPQQSARLDELFSDGFYLLSDMGPLPSVAAGEYRMIHEKVRAHTASS